jgi:hypothetical protein
MCLESFFIQWQVNLSIVGHFVPYHPLLHEQRCKMVNCEHGECSLSTPPTGGCSSSKPRWRWPCQTKSLSSSYKLFTYYTNILCKHHIDRETVVGDTSFVSTTRNACHHGNGCWGSRSTINLITNSISISKYFCNSQDLVTSSHTCWRHLRMHTSPILYICNKQECPQQIV